jgi:hypothetical protein
MAYRAAMPLGVDVEQVRHDFEVFAVGQQLFRQN